MSVRKMEKKRFTDSLGSMKEGIAYDKDSYIRGHSNEAVRSHPRDIPILFSSANCVRIEGPRNARTYTRANPNPELCSGCPLYEDCTLR